MAHPHDAKNGCKRDAQVGCEITLASRVSNATLRVMKYEHLVTHQDRIELQAAEALVKDGKALRQRVLSRLRARAFRNRASENGE